AFVAPPPSSVATVEAPTTGPSAQPDESSSAATAAEPDSSGPTFMELPADVTPPAVSAVYANGTAWSTLASGGFDYRGYLSSRGLGDATYGFAIPGDANQLLALPYSNANQITIRFTEPVTVHQSDLTVT